MTQKSAQVQFTVTNAKGLWVTVIAAPNSSSSPTDGSEPELVYGIGGISVERISEHEFRDFQGTIWTIIAP